MLQSLHLVVTGARLRVWNAPRICVLHVAPYQLGYILYKFQGFLRVPKMRQNQLSVDSRKNQKFVFGNEKALPSTAFTASSAASQAHPVLTQALVLEVTLVSVAAKAQQQEAQSGISRDKDTQQSLDSGEAGDMKQQQPTATLRDSFKTSTTATATTATNSNTNNTNNTHSSRGQQH